jgi:hypothetical protein
MKKLLSRGLLGVAALAVPLGASMALPIAAYASPSTVKAVTHSYNHPDTTSLPGVGACTDNTGNDGPVWAYDNLSIQLSAVQHEPNQYTVTVTTNGSFNAFANPKTGACYTGTGSVTGMISYEVSSSTPPSAKNLPAQEPGSDHLSAIVNDLFGGNLPQENVVGGHYSFSYTPIDGGLYTQVG